MHFVRKVLASQYQMEAYHQRRELIHGIVGRKKEDVASHSCYVIDMAEGRTTTRHEIRVNCNEVNISSTIQPIGHKIVTTKDVSSQ